MKKVLFILALIFFITWSAYSQFDDPPKADVSAVLSQSVFSSEDKTTLSVTYEFPEGYHQTLQEDFFYFTIDEDSQFILGEIAYPEGILKDDLVNYYSSAVVTAEIQIPETLSPGEYELKVNAFYQLCDDAGTCYLPQSETFILPVTLEPPSAGGFSFSILQFILFAFIGGLLLNIMPCVLPLLSVRALSLVRESQNDKKSIFLGSMAYTGGIIVSFIVLAAVIVALKASGELVGWGFQLQNPGFIIALVAIIYVFALSLFDVFVLSPPGMNIAAKASGRKGYAGSFFTGVFAVLVATPCTAPFLGSALGFAFTQPPLIIFAIFIFIGIGLAFPFILLGIRPGLVTKIPKPGKWMTIFKEIMGFLLVGTAVYLLNTLYKQIGGGIVRVIIFLTVLTFAAWFFGRFAGIGASKKRRIIITAITAVIAITGGMLSLDLEESISRENTEQIALKKENWEVFTPEKVQMYREAGFPVFIDFYAEWCTNCKINEARVLSTDEVLSVFKENDTKLLLGDFTLNDPVIAEWIRNFGKGGVPVYALYLPGSDEPIIFPELLSKNMIINAFN